MIQTQRSAWDGWEFAGFLRTDGAAACVALKKATAAGGSGTDSSPSRGRAGSRARGRGGRRAHSSGGSGNEDDDQRGPRGGPGRAPGDNPVPGVVAAGDPLAVFEQATLSPMRIVGVDPGVGNYLVACVGSMPGFSPHSYSGRPRAAHVWRGPDGQAPGPAQPPLQRRRRRQQRRWQRQQRLPVK